MEKKISCEKCPYRKMADEYIESICEIKRLLEDEIVARHYYQVLTEEKEKFESAFKEGKTMDCEKCPIKMISDVWLQSERALERELSRNIGALLYNPFERWQKEREKELQESKERFRIWLNDMKKRRGY
jgi:glyoxylase-like metal-dependent hydrolase (beta-lactamase superfamily II)